MFEIGNWVQTRAPGLYGIIENIVHKDGATYYIVRSPPDCYSPMMGNYVAFNYVGDSTENPTHSMWVETSLTPMPGAAVEFYL